YRLISQRFYHPDFKIISSRRLAPGYLRAKSTQTGKTELLIEYLVRTSNVPLFQLKTRDELTTKQREKYLSMEDNIDPVKSPLSIINQSLQSTVISKSDLLHKIFRYSQGMIAVQKEQYDDLAKIIKSNKSTNLGRAKLMIALCRLNAIPARLVSGVVLEPGTSGPPYFWVEVYDEENNWQSYDPLKGYENKIPGSYVKFSYDTTDFLSISDGNMLASSFTLSQELDIENTKRFRKENNIINIFDLQRLDTEVKNALILLLLLPFCVFLTASIRNLGGFYPYGTFTAPLLALAMVYAEVLITLILAGIVIFLALVARSLLPKSLPRTSRLTLIFTFVAMSMVLSVSIMSYFSLNPAGTIVLLPTIILVAIVDRFYSYMDRVSAEAAIARLVVTILISFMCIPILQSENLGLLILDYPEIHFITAALILWLSNYKGRKLTDNKYLHLLGENKENKQKKSEKQATDKTVNEKTE
ncbi:MAG: transglutaminase-like domain-containing protein, partial [Gammaproteobacteria bacterium]|nr:transglutaminase-like domain-containing protein [Gammaproteobacteria bacterium]